MHVVYVPIRMGGKDFKRKGETLCLDVRGEIRFAINWRENRDSVCSVCVWCVCLSPAV